MKRFNGKFNKTVSVLVAASLVFGNNYPYVHADETGEPVEYEEPAGNEEVMIVRSFFEKTNRLTD